ncbi:MAG: sugar ABC transporter permease [Chloroflexi bacterium]|nr:MAG: sugar ABC transporter permease [Chloroflexota bacterium]
MQQREERDFYLFVSPWILGIIFLFGGPIIASFGLSLTSWTGVSIESLQFVGLQNYQDIFSDELFRTSLINTIYYAVGSVSLGIVVSLFIAILLNQNVPGTGIFRTLFYLPSITAGVAMAVVWIWVFNPRVGLFNFLLGLVGVAGPAWLKDTNWALPALILMSLWQTGSYIIILLAGLQGVPQSLYEAAEIDGANRWNQFRHVTLPMISPALFLVVVIATVNSFQIFVNIRVMTQGGPGTSTMVYVYYLYQNTFSYLRMGYGSALAWVLFVVIGILTWLQFKASNSLVHYEGG